MRETSFIMSVSLAAGAISLIGSMLFLPRLYWEMVDLKDEVFEAVGSFQASLNQLQVETDSSWIELMNVQVSHTPPSKPRENPLLRREKR
ncbi:nematode cuticle collagen domain protein [Cooperia oncophora]